MNSWSYYISLYFLIACAILAVFAYVIIPDKSKNANDQHTEIALRSLGYETQFLVEEDKSSSSFLKWILNGKYDSPLRIQYDDKRSEDNQWIINNAMNRQRIVDQNRYPNLESQTYWLGTDRFGRDQLSRLVLGIRISLGIGFMAVLISLFIGIALGAMAGFYGGWMDRIVMYFVNVVWSIPTLLLVFVVVLALGRGMSSIFIAVGLTMWVDVARLVRGQVLSIKNNTYVRATRSLAYSSTRTIIRHVLPNIVGPVLVVAASNFAIAILIEAGLSYLGFGVQPPAPSLGNMLNENYGYAISGKIYLALFPALMIMLLVLSFNILGTHLRDRFDVKKV